MPRTNFRSMPYQKDRGFTMIELMITIIIIGILTTVALPAYQSFIASQRIKTASFDILAALSLARSEAIKRNTSVAITPTGGSLANGWTITVPATAVTLSQQSALRGLTINCMTGGVATVCPANITYANNGRIDQTATPPPLPSFQVFSSADGTTANTRCISIDLTGRPISKQGGC